MDSSIVLAPSQRNRLLELYRKELNPQVRLRAHLLLLLGDGYAWSLIAAVLFCSTATIARWKERFEQNGIPALLEEERGQPSILANGWSVIVARWVRRHSPLDFGYIRSRWCCATLSLVLFSRFHLTVSQETVRRWLRAEGLVWRRPRPVLKLKDPQHKQKMRKIRRLLRHLGEDEVAVFCDEVDINTNPKIGCMWMRRGKQAQVLTPGDNTKRYWCGSMHWRTGQLIVTEGRGRNKELFLAHLDDLRRHYRRYRKIHVICDNARFHDPEHCKAIREYMALWGDRLVLHFLPKRAPQTNPIERVWWHLHEEITRNHRCESIEQLVELVLKWIEDRGPFQVEGHIYQELRAALNG
jgi:transposase